MKTLHFDIVLNRKEFSLNMSLTVQGSGITALLGPSGCGKSTLLRTIAGLEIPHQGHIRLDDKIWFDSEQNIFLKPQKRRAGFMFQNYALFPHMSVIDNINFGAPKNSRSKVMEWVRMLQIEDITDRRPDQISGGQSQRVALARALAMAPDLLLLDEPFSSVDAGLRHHLRQLLREAAVKAGIPVLLVTHDLDDVRETSDWVGVMDNGCLKRFGSVSEVLTDPRDFEVARILGWPNLLQVTDWRGGEVCGPWGSLPVSAVDYAHQKTWVAVSQDRIRLGGSLSAEVVRTLDMGSHRRIFCRLRDGSRLNINLPNSTLQPGEGDRIRLSCR